MLKRMQQLIERFARNFESVQTSHEEAVEGAEEWAETVENNHDVTEEKYVAVEGAMQLLVDEQEAMQAALDQLHASTMEQVEQMRAAREQVTAKANGRARTNGKATKKAKARASRTKARS